ncbi:MAG: PBP1A family penicillin-binding protein [Legionellales bacterium]|nr:PBP1A family penicillin-binding protein [Legionellales bacterium]
MSWIKLFFRRGLWALLSLMLAFLVILALGYLYLNSQLPTVDTLREVQLQEPLRVYTRDGKLITTFGEKRRIPITIDEVPPQLIQAILATEDQRFYSHPGIDIYGLARAAIELAKTGEKVQGGSTITMQVARNFFLSNKKTYLRKVNEILLAIKIDRELSKDKILELYLNKIYLGNRAYGVAAAAKVYYGKPLSELTLAQLAMIAGLPKAPSAINPLANPKAAFKRRNHVLSRMLEEGYITQQQYNEAITEKISAIYHGPNIEVHAPYVGEMIRQALYSNFGEQAYTRGYHVYTTVDSRLQQIANATLQHGLIQYEQRHDYRGAETQLAPLTTANRAATLKALQTLPTYHPVFPAIVTDIQAQSIQVMLANEQIITINWDGLAWARKRLPNGHWDRKPTQSSDIVKLGDVIRVYQTENHRWQLTQIPEIEGSLIALRPQDGAIQALVGGFSYQKSNFNRATQAKRQPGSSFKPFIYAAALAKGFTLATMINDAPIILDDPSLETQWRPQNHNRKFYGPTRLREGLIRSRNLVSIRLLEGIGIVDTIDFLAQLGFDAATLPRTLSLALGSLTATPMELTAGYAIIANGGYRITPYLIHQITDSQGEILLAAQPGTACKNCANPAPQVMDERVAYLISSALSDTITRGTGRAAQVLNRQDLAGKTGSTNDFFDAWFSGYNANLLTTIWLGFDQPKSLREYGSRAALPIWIDFMRHALFNQPHAPIPQPLGIDIAEIDPASGQLANPGQTDSIIEYFREELVPQPVTDTGWMDYYQSQSKPERENLWRRLF